MILIFILRINENNSNKLFSTVIFIQKPPLEFNKYDFRNKSGLTPFQGS